MTISSLLDRNATADQVVAALDEFGYAIVRELADPATMDRLNSDFDPYLDRVQLGRTEFAGHRTKRINNLIAKSRACQELAAHPLVMAACDRVLLPHCIRYHLHVTAVIELQPGERAQVPHRDGSIYPVLFPSIPLTLATIWACSDFTAENGGTSVAPGSHRWPHDRKPRSSEIVPTVMPRGSVLIYASNLLHGSGENRSNGVRRGMALHYNLGCCARKRTSTSRCRSKSRATCRNRSSGWSAMTWAGPIWVSSRRAIPRRCWAPRPATWRARRRNSTRPPAGCGRCGSRKPEA